VRLVSARFGAESGMLGAACMAFDVAGVPVGPPSALGPGTGSQGGGTPWA
jgi:hypothetical protein